MAIEQKWEITLREYCTGAQFIFVCAIIHPLICLFRTFWTALSGHNPPLMFFLPIATAAGISVISVDYRSKCWCCTGGRCYLLDLVPVYVPTYLDITSYHDLLQGKRGLIQKKTDVFNPMSTRNHLHHFFPVKKALFFAINSLKTYFRLDLAHWT